MSCRRCWRFRRWRSMMSLAAGVPAPALGTVVLVGTGCVARQRLRRRHLRRAARTRHARYRNRARDCQPWPPNTAANGPSLLALVLCAVVALLFTSLAGLGAIIMVGSIVLPIMMTTGVPRKVAATLFLMAFALGFHLQHRQLEVLYTSFSALRRNSCCATRSCWPSSMPLALVVYAVVVLSPRTRLRDVGGSRRTTEANDAGVPHGRSSRRVLPFVLYYRAARRSGARVPAFGGLRRAGDAPARLRCRRCCGRDSRRRRRCAGDPVVHGHRHAARRNESSRSLPPRLRRSSRAAGRAIPSPTLPSSACREPARALSRSAQSVRRRHRHFHRAARVARPSRRSILVAAVMAVVQVQNVCDPTNTANVWVANFTGVPIDDDHQTHAAVSKSRVATAATLAVAIASRCALRTSRPLRRSSLRRCLCRAAARTVRAVRRLRDQHCGRRRRDAARNVGRPRSLRGA